ncbi:MAG TPA: DedA family protein [Sphingorhabdus sp.]|jgi:membrane protein DedA with SNARE-associated domain|nr:DedA family protein [Sphingorhabdus sp.]
MDDWIIRLVDSSGYWGVAFLMLIETVFPPVPSEVIMTVAGVSAQRGNMSFAGVVASGTAGAMVGNYLWYLLARKYGTRRLKALIDRYGRWLTLHWDDVGRGQVLFKRHGSIIVLVARMLPTFRSLISVPAGIFKMSHRRFLIFSTIGTAGWSAALAGAGYALGAQFAEVEKILGPLSTVIVALIVLAYVWRLVRWKPKHGDAH